jgi:hypothetical protein
MLKKAVEKFGGFIFVYIFVRSIRHNIKNKRYEKRRNFRTHPQQRARVV